MVTYTAYELVNIPERSIYRVPAPGMTVVSLADHEAALKAAQHMDDLLEQDGRTDDQVWEHIDWCRQQAEAVR